MIQEAWVVVPILLLFWALVSLYKTSVTAAAAAKSLQSCLTLSDPIDGSPPGSAVHGIFQARVLEWVAIAFSASVTRLRDFPSCEILRFHNVFQALHFENTLHL